MNKRMHGSTSILYWIIGVVVYLFIPLSLAQAVGEFQADYDVTYAVSPTGTTVVTQNVTLTNNETNLYPQKYSILIDSQKIRNVIAYDNGGIVSAQIQQQDGKTDITLPFNEHVVGLGKQLKFSLRYEDADIAQKNGSIWEINIPGVTNDPDLATYFVTLSVPPTFGPNAYMSPLPSLGGRWTKEQMISGGISAAYGTEQFFDIGLTYNIENASVAPRSTEIALPPNTSFQKVIINSLDPKPKTILRDKDGNWLAQYDLLPAQRMEIQAGITVSVRMAPYEHTTEEINRDDYLRPLKYWESQSKEIMDLAAVYKTPRDIYAYVVRTLSYDYNRVNQSPVRKGALWALASPTNSICMEFTDLFIAIARAAGIPARQVLGYAYTTNAKLRPLSLVSDVLHAWPEYYDDTRTMWIPIDPTWANTTRGVNYFDKLDFNHIAFAIQGQSSEYPYPAGYYKKSGSNSKDVTVQFSDHKVVQGETKLSVSYNFPKSVTSGFSAVGSVVIENPNGSAVPSSTILVQSTPFDVAITKTLTDIPPYARVSIPVSIPLPNYFMKGTGTITTTIDTDVSKYSYEIKPFIYLFIIPIFLLSAICIFIAVITARHSLLWKRYKK
jgi:transglutaminase-like putative cysteine protease